MENEVVNNTENIDEVVDEINNEEIVYENDNEESIDIISNNINDEAYDEKQLEETFDEYNPNINKGISNTAILCIIISICVIAGIALGILMGKRAAKK